MSLDKKWTDTIDDGITNTQWDEYDKFIQSEIDSYNTRFATTPGYAKVDWKLVKAMIWTESGGPSSPDWKKRVMQMGNSGDASYPVVKAGRDHSDVIMTATLASDLKKKSIDDPFLNIQAGIAYLFTRLATFKYVSIDDPTDTKEYEDKLQTEKEYVEAFSKRVGSTVEVVHKLNPTMRDKFLHKGQVLKYKKASMQWVITGWAAFTTANAALKYNGGGDANYGEKLDYCMATLKKLKGR